MADNTLASLLTRNALGYGETPVLDSLQGDGITYDTADILRRVRKPNALADALRVAKTYVPENTELPQPQFFMDPRAMSLRNALRGGLDTAANWVEGRPEIGPDTLAPLGAGVMTSMGLNAFGMLPKNSLGIFGGRLAKTADHAALAKAEEMAAKGADRKAIWDETGWFQGADGKWRFEIDDRAGRFTTGVDEMRKHGPADLDRVYGHEQLFDAYPDVRNVKFHPTTDMEPGQGSFVAFAPEGDKATGAIRIGYSDESPAAAFASHMRGENATLHELQHWIQRVGEGNTARGGNTKMFTPEEIAAERHRLNSIPEDHGWGTISTFDASSPDRDIAMRLYQRLAGEVEARNVQTRQNLSPAERRAKPPWETEDVPANLQIIRK